MALALSCTLLVFLCLITTPIRRPPSLPQPEQLPPPTQTRLQWVPTPTWRKLTFGVGIEDNSATREQVAVFTLIADGKPIFEKTTQKNEPVTSQEVDVTNVLTLELAVTATKNKTSQLVWMTPQLHS